MAHVNRGENIPKHLVSRKKKFRKKMFLFVGLFLVFLLILLTFILIIKIQLNVTETFESTGSVTPGYAYSWGWNLLGQLGNGSIGGSSGTPSLVVGNLSFALVNSGDYHACGIITNGSAYCWGYNDQGRLGSGSVTGQSAIPLLVVGNLNFTSIAAGAAHTCGINTNGVAYCWGSKLNGLLGDGSLSGNTGSPLLVLGNLNFTSIATGAGHTCGIITNGSAYCWGVNQDGKLGNGSVGGISPVPLLVVGNLNFTSVVAGKNHACGIITNGSAYCWGYNFYGALGNGASGDSSGIPSLVVGNLNFISISVGEFHSCGIITNGSAYCWGRNSLGRLGLGSIGSGELITTPSLVVGNLNFTSIDLGLRHSCGIITDGSAYCWGDNQYGQLGNEGIGGSSGTPSVVGNLSFALISAGLGSTLGIILLDSVEPDLINPTINIIYPPNNFNSNDPNLDIVYMSSDNIAVSSCWYSNDTYLTNVSLGAACDNITSVVWGEGNHNVTIWVNDTSNNRDSSEVSFTIDSENPKVFITYPINNTNLVNINPIVNYTVSDNLALSKCWYSNDSYSVNLSLENCGDLINVTWAEGQHDLTIWANDTSGNENNSRVVFNITSCSESWACTEWTTCSDGTQTRVCTDSNSCGGISGKPLEVQSCTGGHGQRRSGDSVTLKKEVVPGNSTEVVIDHVEIDLTAIILNVKESTSTVHLDLEISIQTIDLSSDSSSKLGLPSSGEIYQAFNVSVTGVNKSNIENVVLNYRVNKIWLNERGDFTLGDINLYRENSNGVEWDSLNTTSLNNDNRYHYFSAVSPGFSTFLIFLDQECIPSEKRCAVDKVQFCSEDKTWIVNEVCDYQCKDAVCVEKGPLSSLVIYLVLGIVAVGVLVLFLVNRRIKKKIGRKTR